MSPKTFPTLYKLSETGAIIRWDISAEPLGGPGLVANQGIIITRWGQEEGAIQETRDVITKGKNGGKKNATTPFEQACKEAQSRWEKAQKAKGYVQTREAAVAKLAQEEFVKGGILPMLAEKFHECGDKLVWPALAQRKLDGHRCIAEVENGVCTLWSRTRQEITSVPHINRALERAFPGKGYQAFDGELYDHDYFLKHGGSFQKMSGLLRRKGHQPEAEFVAYHIYDLPASKLDNANRVQVLEQMFRDGVLKDPKLVLVETFEVANEDEALALFERFLAEKYEGLMLRNAKAFYQNRRSTDLQKVKEFEDNEYRVIGVKQGRGKMAGLAVFSCERQLNGQRLVFDVKMKGELENLRQYVEDPSLAIGRLLTVKHQGYYDSGIPRIPVAWRFFEEL